MRLTPVIGASISQSHERRRRSHLRCGVAANCRRNLRKAMSVAVGVSFVETPIPCRRDSAVFLRHHLES